MDVNGPKYWDLPWSVGSVEFSSLLFSSWLSSNGSVCAFVKSYSFLRPVRWDAALCHCPPGSSDCCCQHSGRKSPLLSFPVFWVKLIQQEMEHPPWKHWQCLWTNHQPSPETAVKRKEKAGAGRVYTGSLHSWIYEMLLHCHSSLNQGSQWIGWWWRAEHWGSHSEGHHKAEGLSIKPHHCCHPPSRQRTSHCSIVRTNKWRRKVSGRRDWNYLPWFFMWVTGTSTSGQALMDQKGT